MVSTLVYAKHTFRGLDAMVVCPYLILSFTTGQLTYETHFIGGIITFIFNILNIPSWVDMEINAYKQIYLPALLASNLQLTSYTSIDCPVVKHSLRIWIQFRKAFGFRDPSVLSPVFRNHFFPPSMQDVSFKSLSHKGIKCFKDLFVNNVFASFWSIGITFRSYQVRFFSILARHYVKSPVPDFPTMPSENPLDRFLSSNIITKGSIAIIYNLMINLASSSLDNIKRAWEEDLDRPLSEDTWNCVLKQVHSSSICARHSLIQVKVVHRAHIIKVERPLATHSHTIDQRYDVLSLPRKN